MKREQRRFYREVLGLAELKAGDGCVWFDFGGSLLELLARAPLPQYDQRGITVAFEVDDIHAACAQLLGRGVEQVTGVEGGPSRSSTGPISRMPRATCLNSSSGRFRKSAGPRNPPLERTAAAVYFACVERCAAATQPPHANPAMLSPEQLELLDKIADDLRRARAMLPPQADDERLLRDYQDYLDACELELACDELEAYGERRPVSREFWRALHDASMKMELHDHAVRYDRKATAE